MASMKSRFPVCGCHDAGPNESTALKNLELSPRPEIAVVHVVYRLYSNRSRDARKKLVLLITEEDHAEILTVTDTNMRPISAAKVCWHGSTAALGREQCDLDRDPRHGSSIDVATLRRYERIRQPLLEGRG